MSEQKESSGFWKSTKGLEEICTTSGLRAWWLSSFRGYKVRSIVQLPHRGPFGSIRYHRRWVLAPRGETGKAL